MCSTLAEAVLNLRGSDAQFARWRCSISDGILKVIEGKGVWIPYGEVKRVLDARIAYWNRQTGAAAVSDESEIPSPLTLENQT